MVVIMLKEWREWGLALAGQAVEILLLLCTVCLISWVIISDPSQDETLSSRLQHRVGTVSVAAQVISCCCAGTQALTLMCLMLACCRLREISILNGKKSSYSSPAA